MLSSISLLRLFCKGNGTLEIACHITSEFVHTLLNLFKAVCLWKDRLNRYMRHPSPKRYMDLR